MVSGSLKAAPRMLESGMFIHWMRQAIGRKEGGEMRGKRKHFGWFAVMLGLLLFAAAGMKASADMGPKSELVVVVRNPPQEHYIVSLMFQTDAACLPMREKAASELTSFMVKQFDQEYAGWYSVTQVSCQKIPRMIVGDLQGQAIGPIRLHRFMNMAITQPYKLMIVTESGHVWISDPIFQQTMQLKVTVDYATGKLTVPPQAEAYFFQYLSTLLLTLLVEGAVLIKKGFSLRENAKVFVLTNGLTQGLMTLWMLVCMNNMNLMLAIVLQGIIELPIVLIEVWIYRRWLKGQTKEDRTVLAVDANLASWTLGMGIMLAESLLIRLLF